MRAGRCEPIGAALSAIAIDIQPVTERFRAIGEQLKVIAGERLQLASKNGVQWEAIPLRSAKRGQARDADSSDERRRTTRTAARAHWQRAQLRQAVRWRGRQGGRGDRGTRREQGRLGNLLRASPIPFPLSAAPPPGHHLRVKVPR